MRLHRNTGAEAAPEIPVYTWAALPTSAILRQQVLVQDTYDTVAMSYSFEYRPDLDATYPWAAFANQGWLRRSSADGTFSSILSASWVTVSDVNQTYQFRLPRAGVYDCEAAWWASNVAAAADVGFAIGTAAPATFDTTSVNDPRKHTGQVTGVVADYANLRARATDANDAMGAITYLMRPVKIS